MTDLLSRVSRSAFGYLGGDGGGGGGGGENEFVGSIVDVDGMQIQVGLIAYSYRAFCININQDISVSKGCKWHLPKGSMLFHRA
jgi:hypothetical protein